MNPNKASMARSVHYLSLVIFLIGTVCAAQNNPVPLLAQPLNPDHQAPALGHSINLVVRGSQFVSGSLVHWNGSPRSTTFVSKTVLHATITAADLATPGSGAVTVTNPAPGGGSSNVIYFPIHRPNATVALARRDTFPAYVKNSGQAAGPIAIGDFDGDGKPDIAVAINVFQSGLRIDTYLGNGNGTFQAPKSSSSQWQILELHAADLNGDGKLDLLASYNNVVVSDTLGTEVFLGNGDGTFTQQPVLPIVTSKLASGSGNSVSLGDFNGDGNLDLVTLDTQPSSLLLYPGNGDGTFGAAQTVWHLTNGNIFAPIVADFNGDGKLDIALSERRFDAAMILNMFRGKGDGTFWKTASTTIPTAFFSAAAVGDINHDGRLDIVTRWGDVLLGNGDGTFTSGSPVTMPGAGTMQIADLNNDGKLDLVVLGQPSSNGVPYTAVSVLLGNGDGTFQSAQNWNSEVAPTALLGIADFNGDGLLDVADSNTYIATANALPAVSVFLQTSLNVTPNFFNFGKVKVGTTSSPQVATLTNTGLGSLTLGTMRINAGAVADYSQTTTCGSTLAVAASCTVSVSFTPTKAVERAASITIPYNQATGPQHIEVAGQGSNK